MLSLRDGLRRPAGACKVPSARVRAALPPSKDAARRVRRLRARFNV